MKIYYNLFPLFVVLGALGSCASIYVYPEEDVVITQTEEKNSFSDLVILVERNPDNYDYGWSGKPVPPYDIDTFVEALREHHIFKEIAFDDELTVQPDLKLSNYLYGQSESRGVHGESGGFLCMSSMIPISLVTLTIIPIYCSEEHVVTFTLTYNKEKKEMEFIRRNKSIVGIWAPILAWLNADWEYANPKSDEQQKFAEKKLNKNYKVFVAKTVKGFEDEIIEMIEHGADSK